MFLTFCLVRLRDIAISKNAKTQISEPSFLKEVLYEAVRFTSVKLTNT